MNKSDIWIGDYVLIRSQNLRGRFEGMENSELAKINISGNLVMTPVSDLEWCEDPIEEVNVILIDNEDDRSTRPIKPKMLIGDVIDLHYEKLAPERQNNPHPHIIVFQLEKCKEFIETALQKKFTFIRIIHGRGQGKLKAAVEELLKNYNEISIVSSTPDQGALEIWLK